MHACCDFTDIDLLTIRGQPHERMESALLTELTTSLKGLDIHEQQAVVDYSNHEIQSVYFGGGTPSLARPQVVERVLSLLRNQYKLLETAEVTLEANASVN